MLLDSFDRDGSCSPPQCSSDESWPLDYEPSLTPTELLSSAIKKRRELYANKERDYRRELLHTGLIQNLCKYLGESRARQRRRRNRKRRRDSRRRAAAEHTLEVATDRVFDDDDENADLRAKKPKLDATVSHSEHSGVGLVAADGSTTTTTNNNNNNTTTTADGNHQHQASSKLAPLQPPQYNNDPPAVAKAASCPVDDDPDPFGLDDLFAKMLNTSRLMRGGSGERSPRSNTTSHNNRLCPPARG